MKKFNYYCLMVAVLIGIINTLSSFQEDLKTIDESLKNLYIYSSIFYLIIVTSVLVYTFFKKYKEISLIIIFISTSLWGLMTQFCIPSGYLTFIIVSFFYSLFYGVGFKKQVFLIILFSILNVLAINSTNSLNKMGELKDQFQFDYSATVIIFCVIIISITYFKNKQTKEKELVENKLIDAGSQTSIFIHDLKNMIVPMKNYVDIIKMNSENSEENENISELSDSISDLSNFIKEYNQSFSFKQDIIKVNLKEIVDSLNKIYKNKFKNIKISIDQKEELVCDVNIIKSIISNLILNSCDAFSEKNTANGEINISFKNKTLNYSDNAGGIPLDKLKMIQDDSFFSTKKNGSGVGIFTIKKYISLLNGKISFENKNNGVLVKINF